MSSMSSMVLDIRDEKSVKGWKERAQKLNATASQLVKESAEALEEFKQTAEGQIFDNVVAYSSGVIKGTAKVLEGMNEILNVVNTLVANTKNKVEELVENVKNVSTKLLG